MEFDDLKEQKDLTVISKQTQRTFICLSYLKLLDSPGDFEKLRVIISLRPDKLDSQKKIDLDVEQIASQTSVSEKQQGKLEKTKLYLHDYLFKIPKQENLFKYKTCNARNLLLDATEEIFVEQLKNSAALNSQKEYSFNQADLC